MEEEMREKAVEIEKYIWLNCKHFQPKSHQAHEVKLLPRIKFNLRKNRSVCDKTMEKVNKRHHNSSYALYEDSFTPVEYKGRNVIFCKRTATSQSEKIKANSGQQTPLKVTHRFKLVGKGYKNSINIPNNDYGLPKIPSILKQRERKRTISNLRRNAMNELQRMLHTNGMAFKHKKRNSLLFQRYSFKHGSKTIGAKYMKKRDDKAETYGNSPNSAYCENVLREENSAEDTEQKEVRVKPRRVVVFQKKIAELLGG